jgi:hypothetical protein
MVTPAIVIETEQMVQVALQSREGGEREVETPVGFIDLVTDEYAIEIKHVTAWKDGAKVLLYSQFLRSKKPRVHLFGGYAAEFKEMVERCYSAIDVTVTWERESF